MRPLWHTLLTCVEEYGRVALVSIVATEGSTPREAGARMIVTPEGDIIGTIGGGTLEYRLIEDARGALHQETWRAVPQSVPLGPDLGQCCGGHLTYLIETFGLCDRSHLNALASHDMQSGFVCEGRIGNASHLQRRVCDHIHQSEAIVLDNTVIREMFQDARTPILLFGAGHVGRALTLALAPLPFHIRWIDSRDDAFPQLAPQNVTPVVAADMDAEIRNAKSGSFVLVMTHSHPLDLAIVSAALKRDDLPFVGLIGSETKKARFIKRLNGIGLGDHARTRLVSPIGLHAISGKEPAVIAASIVADLLIRREAMLAQDNIGKSPYSTSRSLDLRNYPYE